MSEEIVLWIVVVALVLILLVLLHLILSKPQNQIVLQIRGVVFILLVVVILSATRRIDSQTVACILRNIVSYLFGPGKLK